MAANQPTMPAGYGRIRDPVFRLFVQDGRLMHDASHEERPYVRQDVEVRQTAGGEVLAFNGSTSLLQYEDAVWPELCGDGAWTIYVRVRFVRLESEQFVLGRFARCFLSSPCGWPQANGMVKAGRFVAANSQACCQQDRFYDVVMRYRPDEGDEQGTVAASVHDAESGTLLGRNRTMLRSFDNMRLGAAPFAVGQGGRYAPFAGEIAAVNVWNEWLPHEAGEACPETLAMRSKHRIAVRPGLRDRRASERWREWLETRERFPIAAWGYFQRYRGDEAEYVAYREANLTMVMAPLGTAAVAERVGLDTILGLWGDDNTYLELYAHPERMRDFVAKAQRELRRVAGYMLADEPRYNGPAIEELNPGFEYLYAHEPRALPIVNLMTYPYNMGGGFEEYVERFIRETHPPFLVSDSYILYRNDCSNDDTFYANNEVIRRKALEADIGFMGFALTTGHKRPRTEFSLRTASESDLHWQVNVMLAYGAQGIWYYNYRIDTRNGDFDEAMVTHAEGQPTRSYVYIRRLNAGVLANGALLMRLRSVGVFHCVPAAEPVPEFAQRYADGLVAGVARLRATSVIAAQFEERDGDGLVYVMLVNRRHADKAEVCDLALATAVDFELEPGQRAELFDSDTGVVRPMLPNASGIYHLTLVGGARALMRICTN